MKAALSLSCIFVLPLVGLLGCGSETVFKARYSFMPQNEETACPSEKVAKPDYSKEIDTYRVQVSGAEFETVRKDVNTAEAEGPLLMEQIPAGDNRNVMVTGLLNKTTIWRGVHQKVKVEPGQTSEVSVLLTRLAAMTCARNPMSTGRIFPSIVQLKDDRILITGGYFEVANDTSCTNCRLYSATPTAEIFDPHKGTFSSIPDMNQARGLHQSAVLADGQVVIVGGARKLSYNPTNTPFPLVPGEHRVSYEVFDPKKETFTEFNGDNVARVFHTATTTADGRVLVAGGGAEVTRFDATKSTMLCQVKGSSVECVEGLDMTYHRIGHTATLLQDGRILFWGGVTDTGANGDCSSASVTQCPEWFWSNEFQPVGEDQMALRGADPSNNSFFAAGTSIEPYGVLLVGGLRRTDTTTDTDLVFSGPRDTVYIYQSSGIGNGFSGQDTLGIVEPRFMLQGATLAREGRAIFAGGYTNLNFDPSNRFIIFDINDSGFLDDITAGGNPVTLRQHRGGLGLVHLGGGAVLAVGGETKTESDTRTALDTAEIFTDKAEPQL